MAISKERVMQSKTFEVSLEDFYPGDEPFVCKMLNVGQHEEFATTLREPDGNINPAVMRKFIHMCVIDPAMTEEEIKSMESGPALALQTALMNKHGWNKEGQDNLVKDFSSK